MIFQKLYFIACVGLLSFSSLAFCESEKGSLPSKPLIIQAVTGHDSRALYKLLIRANHTISLAELRAAAVASGDSLLIGACDTVGAYTDNRLGISRLGLVGLILFFETDGAAETRGETTSFRHTSTIPWDIDYSQKTGNWYVIAGDQIANGHNKVLFRALRYNARGLALIACAIQNTAMPREGKYFSRFGTTRGVMRVYDVIHSHSNGISTHVFCKLYNHGSLEKTLDNPNLHLSLREKEWMSLQILQGLEAIHKAKIVHRDLKSLNLLVDIDGKGSSRRIYVAITDFGHGIPVDRVKGEWAQWNSLFYSPEAIVYRKLHGADYYKADIFAAGCNLYQIFYGHSCPWADHGLVRGTLESEHVRYKKLLCRLEETTDSRRSVLEKKFARHTLTPQEEFEYLVLISVHPDPDKRRTAGELREWLEAIMKK
jgi:hypothetical protein